MTNEIAGKILELAVRGLSRHEILRFVHGSDLTLTAADISAVCEEHNIRLIAVAPRENVPHSASKEDRAALMGRWRKIIGPMKVSLRRNILREST